MFALNFSNYKQTRDGLLQKSQVCNAVISRPPPGYHIFERLLWPLVLVDTEVRSALEGKSRSFFIACVELSKYPTTDRIFAIAEATRGMFLAGMTIYDMDSEAVLAAEDYETIGDNKGEHTSNPCTHH